MPPRAYIKFISVAVFFTLARPALGQLDTCKTLGLPASLYRSVLNAQFSALLGSAQSVPGSFGSLEIDKDQKAKLAASTQPGQGRVIGLEVAGSVDNNGILNFIDDRQSSSTFSALLKLHWLRAAVGDEPDEADSLEVPLKRAPTAPVAWVAPVSDTGRSFARRLRDGIRALHQNQLEYTNSSCHAYLDAARRAGDSLRVRLAAAKVNAPDVDRRLGLAKATEKIRADSNKLADPALDPVIRDSLLADIARQAVLKDIASNAAVVPTAYQQRLSARQRYSADLRAAEQLLKVTGFQMPWVSVTLGVGNTSFKLYSPLAVFDSQFVNDSYASPSVGVSASVYRLSKFPGESFFLTAGLTGSLEDNLGGLRKIDFTDTKQYGPNPDDRVSKKSVTAFAGDYKDNLGAVAFNVDWYRFVFRDNQGAIHLFPAVAVKKLVSPLYTAGVGFLWTVRKQDASFFNAELLFKLTDIDESSRSDDNVWERSQLGLRVSFPILFSQR